MYIHKATSWGILRQDKDIESHIISRFTQKMEFSPSLSSQLLLLPESDLWKNLYNPLFIQAGNNLWNRAIRSHYQTGKQSSFPVENSITVSRSEQHPNSCRGEGHISRRNELFASLIPKDYYPLDDSQNVLHENQGYPSTSPLSSTLSLNDTRSSCMPMNITDESDITLAISTPISTHRNSSPPTRPKPLFLDEVFVDKDLESFHEVHCVLYELLRKSLKQKHTIDTQCAASPDLLEELYPIEDYRHTLGNYLHYTMNECMSHRSYYQEKTGYTQPIDSRQTLQEICDEIPEKAFDMSLNYLRLIHMLDGEMFLTWRPLYESFVFIDQNSSLWKALAVSHLYFGYEPLVSFGIVKLIDSSSHEGENSFRVASVYSLADVSRVLAHVRNFCISKSLMVGKDVF